MQLEVVDGIGRDGNLLLSVVEGAGRIPDPLRYARRRGSA